MPVSILNNIVHDHETSRDTLTISKMNNTRRLLTMDKDTYKHLKTMNPHLISNINETMKNS